MLRYLRWAWLLTLVIGLTGCTGGDSEKGIMKNKEKPVPPAAETKT